MRLYPLTYSQKNIWYTEKTHPNTSIGIVAGTLRMRISIDFNILERAINKFVELNDGMRLQVVEKDGVPYQYVKDYSEFKVEFIDFSSSPDNDLYEFEEEQAKLPFGGILGVPLFVFKMIKISENEGGFYIKTHHLISDAWSMSILGSQIAQIYNKIKNNDEIYEPRPSYLDHIFKEQEYEKSEKYQKDREYWLDKYQSTPDITRLKQKNVNKNSTVAKRKSFVLPEKLTEKIYEYAKNEKTSIFSMYMCAISMYINRVINNEIINLGTVFLNRSDKIEKNTVGMFVTTVPVSLTISDNDNFSQFCKKVTLEMMRIMRHQRYPFSVLQEEIRKKYNTDEVLYDIVLSYQNAKFEKVENIDIASRWHFSGHQSNSLNIHISDRDNEKKIIISYDYLKDLFYDKEIEFIHEHIVRLLWHAIDNPNRIISKIEMVSEKEKNKLLYDFNNTDTAYPKEQSILDLIEETARKYPNNVAIEDKEKKYTYSQLLSDVKKVSSYLIQNGMQKTNIGIYMEHSYETVVAILSIIRAGATYVPLDTKFPKERVENIVNTADIKYFFTQKEFALELGNISKLLYVEDILNLEVEIKEACNIEPENVVYIIFTSGSTGVPKGVMIKHKGLVNYIWWANKVYNFPSKINSYPLYSSLAFDLTVTSIFTPLISGGKIIIYPEDNKENAILRIIKENKCNILKLTPSHLKVLKEFDNSRSSIKRLIVGGEALKSKLCNEITNSFNQDIEIFNEYGPTETVVGCMIYKYNSEIDKKAVVSIGKPADNVKLYVLDKNLNLCPIGMIGELYIAGEGVAKGYINNEKETKKRFIENPYNKNEIIYRTGDLVKWMSKGDMEYFGRSDFQIKIKGFRIEIEEIEKQIMMVESVKEAVVTDIKDKNEKTYLCAYISGNKDIDIHKIKSELNRKLPHYMIPNFFIILDSIPVTPNGKIDRKKLPLPNMGTEKNDYRLPVSDKEKMLADMICEILKIDEIGVDCNIFEFGMDSLSVIQMQSMLIKRNLHLNTQDFYDNPTIEELCKKLEGDYIENTFQINRDIISPITNLKATKNYLFKNVLLTGSTGFLGVHILDYLISNTGVNVWCLIRGENEATANKKLKEILNFYFDDKYNEKYLDRIHVVCGDISENNLGVENISQINEIIDTVFHCAGLVKHYGKYEEFYKINVQGTENIIKFCEQHDKKLNYISTLSVSGSHLTNNEELNNKNIVFDEKSFYIGQKYKDNVYVRSKFEAEELIYEEIRDNKLNASIFRVGNLTWRSTDGKYQKNSKDNAFYGRLKIIYKLKMLPLNLLDTDVEFSPVDKCAEAIVKIAEKFKNISNVYHIYNSNFIKLSDIVKIFENNGSIKLCAQEEFSKEIADNKDMINMFANDTNSKDIIAYDSGVKYNNIETNKELLDLGFKWEKISFEYILNFIESMVE